VARTDSTEVKVAAAVALTAALFSPELRGMLRRGAVRGLVGALTIGDAVASFARGVRRGMQEPDAPPADAAAPDPVAAAVATPGDGAAGATAAVRQRRRRTARPRRTPATPSDAAAPTTAPVPAPVEGVRE
jgi:hypothetical protein